MLPSAAAPDLCSAPLQGAHSSAHPHGRGAAPGPAAGLPGHPACRRPGVSAVPAHPGALPAPPSPSLVTPATARVRDPVSMFSWARRSGLCSSGPKLPQARPPATQPSRFRHPSPETGSRALCQLSALWPDRHPARTGHGGGPGGDLGLRAEQRGGEAPEGPVMGSLQSSGQCVGRGGWPLDPRGLASDRRGCSHLSHPGQLPSCAGRPTPRHLHVSPETWAVVCGPQEGPRPWVSPPTLLSAC